MTISAPGSKVIHAARKPRILPFDTGRSLPFRRPRPVPEVIPLQSRKSVLYIIVTAFCFGTMEVALKIGGSSFAPLQMNFLRFLIGGVVLLPLALREKRRRGLTLDRGDLGYLTLLALVGVCLSMSCFQFGVMGLNANTASVMISSNPVFTMIFAYFLVHEPFTRRKALVLILCVIGLVLVANPMHMAEGNTVKGMVYMSVALVTFALFTALGKLRSARLGGTIQTCFTFLIASVFNLIILLVSRSPIVSGLSLQSLPVLLYCGLVVTGLGYFSYLSAIELAGPSNASIAFFLKPVIAVTAAALILKEPVTPNIVAGVALILIGSFLNLRKAKPAADS